MNIAQNPVARRAFTAMVLLAVAPLATAQTFPIPDKPVKLVVGFPAGGGTDLQARMVAQHLAPILGVPVIVENKPGAGTMLAATEVAKAPADGHTLLYTPASTLSQLPHTLSAVKYDTFKDFTPVAQGALGPLVLVLHKSIPASNVRELVTYAKANPGQLNYVSQGVGTPAHIFGQIFAKQAGIDIVHVPYKGSGPALSDAVGGQVEILFDNLPSSMPQIQAGKLRAIAVAWPQRIGTLKDVPNFTDAGFPVLNQPVWYGLLAPKGTPPEVITKLRDAAVVALKDPKVIKVLEEQGSAPSGNTPEEFAAEIQTQYDWARDVVKKQNIKLN